MKLYFATFFDINYLNRGLVLFESLKRNVNQFQFFVLCLDIETKAFLDSLGINNIETFLIKDFENYFQNLKEAKKNRSKIEYYFTLSPFLPDYILQKYPEVDIITTLDADIMFFSDPTKIYETELKDKSILICPHKFANNVKHKEAFGIYNVSFQAFRRDYNAQKCLEWWQMKCIEWCYDIYEDERFADQKYLDKFSSLFDGVQVLEHSGAALAPWNVSEAIFEIQNGQVFANQSPFVFYHYHHLRFQTNRLIKHNLKNYDYFSPSKDVTNLVYLPYIREVVRINNRYDIKEVGMRYSEDSSIWKILDTVFQGDFYFLLTSKSLLSLNFEKLKPLYFRFKRLFI